MRGACFAQTAAAVTLLTGTVFFPQVVEFICRPTTQKKAIALPPRSTWPASVRAFFLLGIFLRKSRSSRPTPPRASSVVSIRRRLTVSSSSGPSRPTGTDRPEVGSAWLILRVRREQSGSSSMDERCLTGRFSSGFSWSQVLRPCQVVSACGPMGFTLAGVAARRMNIRRTGLALPVRSPGRTGVGDRKPTGHISLTN